MIACLILACGLVAGPGAGAAPDGPEVRGERVEIPGASGPIRAYLATPDGDGPFPAVLVVHDWWGLDGPTEGLARRLAGLGYAALAVDYYGGRAAEDVELAHEISRALEEAPVLADLEAGVAALRARPDVARGRPVGLVGWGLGGTYARRLAQESGAFGALVMISGAVTLEPGGLARLREEPVLGLFAEGDRGTPPERVRQFAAALRAAGGVAEVHIYPGARPGFLRPEDPAFNPEATADAWGQIARFLAEHLGPPRAPDRAGDGLSRPCPPAP